MELDSDVVNVEKFIPQYPDVDDPNFNYDILKKVEFYDLRLDASEKKPDRQGELLQSQKIIQRFFSPHTQYDRSLFIHDPGTGKCIHPETLLDTNLGLFKAEDIWLWFSLTKKVLCHAGGFWAIPTSDIFVKSYICSENKFQDMKIDKLYRQYVSEDLRHVMLENDKTIKITKAHKLYVSKGGYENRYEWSANYEKGDYIMLDGLVQSKIVDIIEKHYEGWVYDFEVMKHHNYIANGILCHNTCLSSAIVESAKNLEVGGVKRKRALIIVKNDGLRRKYMADVANVCTSGVYVPKVTYKDKDLTKEKKERRIKAEIMKTYEIVTLETFLKHLPDDPKFIMDKYSNRDIIIDEAHVLRIQPSRPKKAKDEGKAPRDDKEPKIDHSQYKKMHTFLHTIKGARILLFTGTPIWDDVSEIASLMNLILDEKEQLPTGKDFENTFFDNEGNLKDNKIPELKAAFKGKISYLRKLMTNALREELGVSKPWLKYVKVFPDKMSEDQAIQVREALREEKEKGKAGTGFSRTAREASNMIIPVFNKKGEVEDYVYGVKGFDKYIKTTRKTLDQKESESRYAITNNLLRNYIKNNLIEISTKFASIIEDIKANPNKTIFIYNEFVIGSGGAIMFALCMEIHGFIWAKTANDIKTPSKKQRRFAVITSNEQTTHQSDQIKALLDSANKPDNKYGDRLQVIIGSERISLGQDIFNVRKEHIVTGHWNMSSLDQAKARGFRFGGHDALPENERKVEIISHVAVEGDGDVNLPKNIGYPNNKGFSKYKTVDIHVYEIAENKEHKNTQIYRVAKESAYDCGLFYKRNVLKTDTDGSRDCDYKECKYKCDALPINPKYPDDPYRLDKKNLDYSTYNLIYGDLHTQRLIDSIVELFGNHFSLDIFVMRRLLEVRDEMMFVLLKALDIIIDTRISIKDRYGFNRYLKEDGNIYFLDSSTSGNTRYLEATYVENPLISDITSLEHLVDIMELEYDQDKVINMCKNPSQTIFDSLSYKTKIILLEESYRRKKSGFKPTKSEKLVLDEMGDDIRIVGDRVPVHILYSTEYKGTSFDIAGKKIKTLGEMRYFDKEDKTWKNMTDEVKERQYSEEIKLIEADDDKYFDNNPYDIYGIISKKDVKFRIRLKPEPGKRTTGLVCTSFDEADLRSLFINNLKKFPPAKKDYKKLNKEELLKLILGYPGSTKYEKMIKKKDEKYLRGLLTIFTFSKTQLCQELLKMIKELGILYEK